jgi:hypothetical protein
VQLKVRDVVSGRWVNVPDVSGFIPKVAKSFVVGISAPSDKTTTSSCNVGHQLPRDTSLEKGETVNKIYALLFQIYFVFIRAGRSGFELR